MVATHTSRAGAGLQQVIELRCDPAKRVVNRQRVDRKIAVVGDPRAQEGGAGAGRGGDQEALARRVVGGELLEVLDLPLEELVGREQGGALQ